VLYQRSSQLMTKPRVGNLWLARARCGSFDYGSGSQTAVRVPLVEREGLQGGVRDPSVLLHKKHFVFTYRVLLINSCIFVYFPY